MANLIMPKKFLCSYPLIAGAYAMGIIMGCVSGISAIVFIVQVFKLKIPSIKVSNATESGDDGGISRDLWINIYAVTVVAVVDCVVMIAVNCWFLWGVKKKKSLVILIWLAMTALRLAHMFVLVVVVIIRNISLSHNVVGWSIGLVIFIIVFCVFMYGYFCVYAYWAELQRFKRSSVEQPQNDMNIILNHFNE